MKIIKFENIFVGAIFSFEGIVFRRLQDSSFGEGQVQFVNFPGDSTMNGQTCSFLKETLINY
jgi:hypothetical protein